MYTSLIGSEESLLAEEDEEDEVEPLPDWNTSRHEGILPPKVNPKNFKRCTPSYYLLPKNVNSYKLVSFSCRLLKQLIQTYSFSITVYNSSIKLPNKTGEVCSQWCFGFSFICCKPRENSKWLWKEGYTMRRWYVCTQLQVYFIIQHCLFVHLSRKNQWFLQWPIALR
jgi:hypothetical protein